MSCVASSLVPAAASCEAPSAELRLDAQLDLMLPSSRRRSCSCGAARLSTARRRGARQLRVELLTLASLFLAARSQNCTLEQCFNAENLCGEFHVPCRPVGLAASAGVWISVDFRYFPDTPEADARRFVRHERGALSRDACMREEFWMEMIYEGHFAVQGGSPVVPGSSVAKTDVHAVKLKLLLHEQCVVQSDGSTRCLDTLKAMKTLCPCNGWDWANSGEQRDRNVGMYCREDCPLINDIYLHQEHFYTYNATVERACFSRFSVNEAQGWEKPSEDGCYAKKYKETCQGGALATAGAVRAAGVAASALLLASFGALLAALRT